MFPRCQHRYYIYDVSKDVASYVASYNYIVDKLFIYGLISIAT